MKHKSLFRMSGLLILYMGCLFTYSFRQKAETNQNTNSKIENPELNANDELLIRASENSQVQAFSMGKDGTWKWNWIMHFSKDNIQNNGLNPVVDQPDSALPIGVIELRNYVVKHGLRDSFIHYFEDNLIESQKEVRGYVLGQYRVKGSEDNFCWIRGFEDMKERSSFLPAFYYGPAWQKHKSVANSMLANNDNVYLLRPLLLHNDSLEPAKFINHSLLIPNQGIAVVDFYIANTKLDQLLKLFSKEYLPLLKENGVNDCTLWTSILQENDFPRLPVFQDKNLLITITFFRNELDYEETMKKVNSKIIDELKARLQDVITIKNTMILYPSENTISQRNNQKPKSNFP